MNIGLWLSLSIDAFSITIFSALRITNMKKKDKWHVKPFIRAESHITDARFFQEGAKPKETMSSAIYSASEGGTRNAL